MLSPALQAAGHDGALQTTDGAIFIKPTKQRELDFYRALNDGTHEELADKTCSFMGTLIETDPSQASPAEIQSQNELMQLVAEGTSCGTMARLIDSVNAHKNNKVIIVLENTSYGFKQPNVLDVKLGSVLWDDRADDDKKQRLLSVSNSTTSGSMGMRIAGMTVYDPVNKERCNYDRLFGRQFTEENILQAFSKFFPDQDHDKNSSMAEAIEAELVELKQVLETEECRMISCSILITYEGDPNEFERKLANKISDTPDKLSETEELDINDNNRHDNDHDDEDGDDDDLPEPLLLVRLIDFAHSQFTPGKGPDTNILTGIDSLISIFHTLSA